MKWYLNAVATGCVVAIAAVATAQGEPSVAPLGSAEKVEPTLQPKITFLGPIDKETIAAIALGTKEGDKELAKFKIDPGSLQKVEILKGVWKDDTTKKASCSKICVVGRDGKEQCVVVCGDLIDMPKFGAGP